MHSNACPVAGCRVPIPARHWLCNRHWRFLDKEEQAAMTLDFRRFLEGKVAREDLERSRKHAIQAIENRIEVLGDGGCEGDSD